MVAELKQVPTEVKDRTAREVSNHAEILEDFPFRLSEGTAPIKMKVRPYSIDLNELNRIDARADELRAIEKQISDLVAKRGEVENEAFLDDSWEGELDDYPRIKRIDARLDLLRQNPSASHYMAEHFYCRLIQSWDFTVDGQPLPVTPESVLSLSSTMLGKLRADLMDFFSPETRKKRKV